jgi:integrase
MRPLLATLAGTGLRIGEAVALDWRDVKLGAGTLIVRESKTAGGRGERLTFRWASKRK